MRLVSKQSRLLAARNRHLFGSGSKAAYYRRQRLSMPSKPYGPARGLPETQIGTFSQTLYDEAKSKG
jgi:hypothetical protein